MDRIVVRPGRYRQFGAAEDAAFCLVTTPDLVDRFRVDGEGSYARCVTVPYGEGDSLDSLLGEAVPQPAHVLVISPHRFVVSPAPERLGPRRKLVAMPCSSTPTSLDTITHFLDVMERTDPVAQQAFADRFFAQGQASDCLEIEDERHGTRATFDHLDDSYEWNAQVGMVEWGEQQIAPAGELSCLPADIMEFSPRLRLAVNGRLALTGPPVVHSGKGSFLAEDQARIHAALGSTSEEAVVATVEGGVIAAVSATGPASEAAVEMLDALFRVDSRYRIVWEMGFGINSALTLAPGNVGMNEPYGGANGCFHFGIGLTPYTQYALIFLCPGSRVLGRDGALLLGPPASSAGESGGRMRRRTGGCRCHA